MNQKKITGGFKHWLLCSFSFSFHVCISDHLYKTRLDCLLPSTVPLLSLSLTLSLPFCLRHIFLASPLTLGPLTFLKPFLLYIMTSISLSFSHTHLLSLSLSSCFLDPRILLRFFLFAFPLRSVCSSRFPASFRKKIMIK